MTLLLHTGGWEATKTDLAAVPVPDPTDTYMPVPYPRFVEEVELHVPRFGLTIEDEKFALARDGSQMFGVLTCSDGSEANGHRLAIGLRTSLDRSLALSLTSGTRVLVCDNLAFSGEAKVTRKHTVNVFRDLPDLIYRMLSEVSAMRERIEDEIAAMRERTLSQSWVDHLLVRAMAANVLPASGIPKVLEAWDEPRHAEFAPRTAWSLFNAFTEVGKARSPRQQMDDTLRLTGVFRTVLEL